MFGFDAFGRESDLMRQKLVGQFAKSLVSSEISGSDVNGPMKAPQITNINIPPLPPLPGYPIDYGGGGEQPQLPQPPQQPKDKKPGYQADEPYWDSATNSWKRRPAYGSTGYQNPGNVTQDPNKPWGATPQGGGGGSEQDKDPNGPKGPGKAPPSGDGGVPNNWPGSFNRGGGYGQQPGTW